MQPIFDDNCMDSSCHDSTNTPGALLYLDAGYAEHELFGILADSLADDVDLPRVTPGAPDESFLWHKLKGTQMDVGDAGVAMPAEAMTETGAACQRKSDCDTGYSCSTDNVCTKPVYMAATPLSDADLETIEAWIEAGAQL